MHGGELTLDRLEAAIAAVAEELNPRMERWLSLVAEFDARGGARASGFRGTAEWLSWRCGIGSRAARDHVRVARRLRELPGVRDAFASGEVSYSKVRALTRVAAGADEADLLELARSSTACQLEHSVRALRTAPSADLEVANGVHARRRITWWWRDDGSLHFCGQVGADEGAALIEALETGAEALHPAEPGQPRPPLGARHVDALTEMVFSGAPRAQVVLHVDESALACTAREPEERAGEVCALQDGPAVPSETARRLACDGEIVNGHGRKRRVVSPALRTSLERRDAGCRFPDCRRRHGLHAHHIEHWAHGGPTDPDNLVLLCRFHHRLVHEEGFAVARAERGVLCFRRPDGRVVPMLPERAPPQRVAA